MQGVLKLSLIALCSVSDTPQKVQREVANYHKTVTRGACVTNSSRDRESQSAPAAYFNLARYHRVEFY